MAKKLEKWQKLGVERSKGMNDSNKITFKNTLEALKDTNTKDYGNLYSRFKAVPWHIKFNNDQLPAKASFWTVQSNTFLEALLHTKELHKKIYTNKESNLKLSELDYQNISSSANDIYNRLFNELNDKAKHSPVNDWFIDSNDSNSYDCSPYEECWSY